jgi:hypothetical protein
MPGDFAGQETREANTAALAGQEQRSASPTEFTQLELSADPILRFFHYAHLPTQLQEASKPFCDLARHVIDHTPRNAERTTALRKLLEAKDCAIRATLPPL